VTWPRPISRAQRRREQEADDAHAERVAHARPNIPPDTRFTNCHMSGFGTHEFTDGVCVFCRARYTDCLRKHRP
jgi:hypothetical protein